MLSSRIEKMVCLFEKFHGMHECMISNRNGFIRKVGAHDENILNERKTTTKKRNNELTN